MPMHKNHKDGKMHKMPGGKMMSDEEMEKMHGGYKAPKKGVTKKKR